MFPGIPQPYELGLKDAKTNSYWLGVEQGLKHNARASNQIRSEHKFSIKKLPDGWAAECSCGWVGKRYNSDISTAWDHEDHINAYLA